MKTVTITSPVVIAHPVTGQYVSFKRGDEVEDDSPFATDSQFAWLFDGPDEPPGRVTSVPVESATAAPGEKRGEVRTYACDDCDFTTTSKRGLKIHVGSQHSDDQ